MHQVPVDIISRGEGLWVVKNVYNNLIQGFEQNGGGFIVMQFELQLQNEHKNQGKTPLAIRNGRE